MYSMTRRYGIHTAGIPLYFWVSAVFCGLMITAMSGCSINRLATRAAADAFASAGGGTTFTGERDPELVRDALPFALKMFESLLESRPEHRPLLETTASGFVAYANAFLHTPADMLDYTQFRQQQQMYKRAAALYMRGRDYALQGLEVRHPGFIEELGSGNYEKALGRTDSDDLPFLYWAAAGWLGAISIHFDVELLTSLPRPAAMLVRVLEIDSAYDAGGAHDFFISLYGSVSQEMLFRSHLSAQEDPVRLFLRGYYEEHRKITAGAVPETGEEKARFHFQKALKYSGGNKASPYLALASTVSYQNQNSREFKELLNKALQIDVDQEPGYRLMNILQQQKAEWMLANIDEFFLFIE